ncbi:MAG: histidine phosphatase family protein [Patulibacter sp.]|nr:histidine phosphatase family protein [Patulibacter sp.]
MILLARHGRTAYNHEGRFQGQGPVPLDAEGRRQAAALADEIVRRGDVTRLISSPITRALETASHVAARTGLVPEIDPRWSETDCGDWQDRSFAEVLAEDADGFAAFHRLELDFAAPRGERYADQLARVRDAADDLRRQDDGRDVILVVCHRNALRLLLRHERGVDPGEAGIPNGHLLTL